MNTNIKSIRNFQIKLWGRILLGKTALLVAKTKGCKYFSTSLMINNLQSTKQVQENPKSLSVYFLRRPFILHSPAIAFWAISCELQLDSVQWD